MSREQHAFLIEAEQEEGITQACGWVSEELGMQVMGNPDVVVLRHGLLSVADARRVAELAAGAPFTGIYKVIIIAANRAYHEAQNALLKLFEEPPPHTYLFFIMPSLGGILPTLRSRSHILVITGVRAREISQVAQLFLTMSLEKRTAYSKRLASGKDEDERRENRVEAIALLNGIETAVQTRLRTHPDNSFVALLVDIAVLRGYLYDRSAPLRMIIEHLSLVIPKNLL